MKKFLIVVLIFCFAIPIVQAASNNENMFFNNLNACKRFKYENYSLVNGYQKLQRREILGVEAGVCNVSIVTVSSSEKSKADAADLKICKIPMENLGNANKRNFNQLKQKFCSRL